jgi:hypothetical protein
MARKFEGCGWLIDKAAAKKFAREHRKNKGE